VLSLLLYIEVHGIFVGPKNFGVRAAVELVMLDLREPIIGVRVAVET